MPKCWSEDFEDSSSVLGLEAGICELVVVCPEDRFGGAQEVVTKGSEIAQRKDRRATV